MAFLVKFWCFHLHTGGMTLFISFLPSFSAAILAAK